MKKRIISLLLAVVMVIGLLPVTALAETPTESFSLGAFNQNTGKFPNVVGTGTQTYTSLMIAYGTETRSGEQMVLPSVSGFTKNNTASTGYSVVINMSPGKTLAEIADYVKQIQFQNSPVTQTVQITISLSEITNKTFYNAANGHYYQYVAYSDGASQHHWIDAYNAAKNMTYAGRTGYLATVTSFEEDLFICNASNAVGFLGGTVLSHGAVDGDLHYTYTVENNGSYDGTVTPWYWACGPERGQVFYEPYDNGTKKTYDDWAVLNYNYDSKGHYHNWYLNNTGYEPNGSFSGSPESCLTTLHVGAGYGAQKAGSNLNISWNDMPEFANYGTGTYDVQGYFVEFGNQTQGDSSTTTDGSITANAQLITTHNFSYGSSGSALTATCTDEQCPTGYNTTSLTLTLTGKDFDAAELTAWKNAGAAVPVIEYYKSADPVNAIEGRITEPGSYIAIATIGEGESAISLSVEFELTEKDFCQHEGFVAITSLTELKTKVSSGGSYYLDSDITLDGDLTINSDFDLCLNGKTLDLNRHHIILSGKTFKLYDCVGGGKITNGYATKADGGGAIKMKSNTNFYMYGGIICNNVTDGDGGALIMTSGANFYMYGGELCYNTAGANCGAIQGFGGYMEIHGGKIHDNNLNGTVAGGISVNQKSTLIMYGGEIFNNNGVNEGGAIRTNDGSTVRIEGGYIGKNTAVSGSGIYRKNTSDKITYTKGRFCTANTYTVSPSGTSTVTFDKNDGTGGTGSITATWNNDLPNIQVPTREGYAFCGYFNENGEKYYNADGTPFNKPNDGIKWDYIGAQTLTAKWHNYAYSSGENVLAATCTDENCPEGYNTTPLTLTLTEKGFDAAELAAWISAGAAEPVIKYYKSDDTERSTAVGLTESGSYVAVATVGTATAEKAFTITMATEDTTTGTYQPTNIINGGFDDCPWMGFKMGSTVYTKEALIAGCSFSGGSTVSSLIYNGPNEGWNTTAMRVFDDGKLFDWTKRANGTLAPHAIGSQSSANPYFLPKEGMLIE